MVRVHATLGHHAQAPLGAGDTAGHTLLGELPLDLVQVDPEAENLGDARPPADDREGAVGVLTREVTGAEGVHTAPSREVGRGGGVAQHHVGPSIDHLADPLLVDGLEADLATGDRSTDRLRTGQCLVRVERGDPCRGLGLPVHDVQRETSGAAQLSESADLVRREASPCRGHVAQRRQPHAREPDAVQHLEGVRNPGERGDRVRGHGVPERGIDHGPLGEQHRCSGEKVAVQDRQPVGVGQRQRRHGPVGCADAQSIGYLLGVGLHVV